MSETTRAEALAFLKGQDVGALATSTLEDGPSVRPVYYAVDDDLTIFFLTLKSTRKTTDLIKNARAAFTIYDSAKPATLELHGTVVDQTEVATIEPIVTELARTIAAKGDHFAPLTRMDPSEVRFFKLTPAWARYADFSRGTGDQEVFREIKF